MERGILYAAAAAVTMVLIAGCGGANENSGAAAAAPQESGGGSSLGATDTGTTAAPSSPAQSTDATAESTVEVHDAVSATSASTGPSLTVRARGSSAGGVAPKMQVLVDGIAVGSIEVKSTAYADYRFALRALPSQRVDVVFPNDGASGSEDRNLYVDSLTVNGATLLPTSPGVTVDIGSGAAAFDGINVIPGRSGVLWNAALRFFAPDNNAPKVTVRARASLAANVGAMMTLFVGGTAVNTVEVRSTTFADYVYSLGAAVAPGTRVDVVFSNDGSNGTEDRNLYVESVTVNSATLLPTGSGVTVDIGSGAAAFDGVNVIAGRTDIRWNAALRLFAP